ncbi:hypothetical protein OPV22_013342 [Ensete ventricosum]|uniref:Uncharacterized protein n=1 Tax=Ensete ventricosum TaxID=4639 RepID=A0AAV8R4Q4_ENSVE|nr:hypothetical protein OPV22_013342 [Ensete ventricosum]
MGDGSSEEEAKELDGTTDKANRFFIDFRKIPDAKSLVPIISPEESKRQNAVESAFQDAESIAKATVPATKVVVTIGVADKGPSAEVTTDVLEVIRAAEHAVVYNSGPGGFSGRSMYNVLDGITSSSNLFVRSQQLTLGESSLVAELDVSYTLIKAGQPHRAHTGWWQQKREIPPKQVNSRSQSRRYRDYWPMYSPVPRLQRTSAIPEDGGRKAHAETVAKAKAEETAAKKLEGEAKEQKARAACRSEQKTQCLCSTPSSAKQRDSACDSMALLDLELWEGKKKRTEANKWVDEEETSDLGAGMLGQRESVY